MLILQWINVVIFFILSFGLLVFTLRREHAHRGYRFLAFECILALIFLQAGTWFVDPLRPVQILSWLILIGSLLLAIHAFRLLSTQGAPVKDLENTTRLVTIGAYRFIRHPLYASLLLFGIGATLKLITPISMAILIALFFAILATGRVEERENLERFGQPYKAYMQKTKMFIPFLF